MDMKNIITFGEVMVELKETSDDHYTKNYAGDVYNSSVYLKRFLTQRGMSKCQVSFLTAAGEDHLSVEMENILQQENIDSSLVFTSPDRNLGLYMINTDEQGERSFTYWRSSSAARQSMKFLRKKGGVSLLSAADIFYFSGISLAILNEEDRQYLLEIIQDLRIKGTKIAFDPNYRAILWETPKVAREWMEKIYHVTDIAFPGLADEEALFGAAEGAKKDHIKQVRERFKSYDISEVILKADELGVFIYDQEEEFHVPFQPAKNCIDTTAAGDSFSGTYMAAKITGQTAFEAAQVACKVAGFVVGFKGAITPLKAYQKFFLSRDV